MPAKRPRDPLFLARHWSARLKPGDKLLFHAAVEGGGFEYRYGVFQGLSGDADYVACHGFTNKRPQGTSYNVHLSNLLYPIPASLFEVCRRNGWPSASPTVKLLTGAIAGGVA